MDRRFTIPGEIEDRTQLYGYLKNTINIAIYGSFQQSRKEDLLALKDYLQKYGYLNTKISEDVSDRLDPTADGGPIRDITLSELLMDESSIHIFVFVKEKEDEHYLIQSISMEFQRLSDLIEFGVKRDQYVAVYVEKGLEKIAGGVFKGQVMRNKHEWDIDFFRNIKEIFTPARRFCERSLADLYGY
ncbi:hypothetical protein ASZ90_010831 [hydrocarbon metagenome]|uniref:Uncharacterized protein n=1 Tax=hydrocarbon metagenome TaxID=938273 RepID=A0A0W8FF20_9ZZZZ